MGNSQKKNSKNIKDKKTDKGSNKGDKNLQETSDISPDEDKNPQNTSTKIKLVLEKKFEALDTVEDVINIPYIKDSIIIACRNGEIKHISYIKSKIILLHEFKEKLYSLILLKKNNNKLCVGLDGKIVLLNLIKTNDDFVLNEINTFECKTEGHIDSLLELENGKIISAGKNFILWSMVLSDFYQNVMSISKEGEKARIINLVEFHYLKTIVATQEDTHRIFVLKNNEERIELIKERNDVPSIWYKGSAQQLSYNSMILVGKLGLNVIDPINGQIYTKYPGIDRGPLLNFTEEYKEEDFWIVTNFKGKYFEFYKQEGNDLIYFEKYEFDDSEKIGWGNRLVKINEDCFASINNKGNIFVFKIELPNKKLKNYLNNK